MFYDNAAVTTNVVIRGNIVLPEDAVQWAARLAAGGPSFDADARQVIKAAGVDFYTTAHNAVASAGCDLKTLAQSISERYHQSRAQVIALLEYGLCSPANLSED